MFWIQKIMSFEWRNSWFLEARFTKQHLLIMMISIFQNGLGCINATCYICQIQFWYHRQIFGCFWPSYPDTCFKSSLANFQNVLFQKNREIFWKQVIPEWKHHITWLWIITIILSYYFTSFPWISINILTLSLHHQLRKAALTFV